MEQFVVGCTLLSCVEERCRRQSPLTSFICLVALAPALLVLARFVLTNTWLPVHRRHVSLQSYWFDFIEFQLGHCTVARVTNILVHGGRVMAYLHGKDAATKEQRKHLEACINATKRFASQLRHNKHHVQKPPEANRAWQPEGPLPSQLELLQLQQRCEAQVGIYSYV